jgi:hypothetical protein
MTVADLNEKTAPESESKDANAARLLLIDSYMTFLRLRAREYFPGRRLEDARALLMVLGVPFSLAMRERPITLAVLSRLLDMPRNTLRRRIMQISNDGWLVVKQDTRPGAETVYTFNMERLKRDRYLKIIRAAVSEHIEVANKLAKMDI